MRFAALEILNQMWDVKSNKRIVRKLIMDEIKLEMGGKILGMSTYNHMLLLYQL